MNIKNINNNMYQNNTNFKSKIVPTKYLERTLDYAIAKPTGQRKFFEGLSKILNDGKNDVVKFDYAKCSLLQKIFPGAYNITVNGEKRMWNTFFGCRAIEAQCEYAVLDYAKNIKGIKPKSKLYDFKKRYEDAWRIFVYSPTGTNRAEKQMKLRLQYLKDRYHKILSEELKKIKEEIFKPEI